MSMWLKALEKSSLADSELRLFCESAVPKLKHFARFKMSSVTKTDFNCTFSLTFNRQFKLTMSWVVFSCVFSPHCSVKTYFPHPTKYDSGRNNKQGQRPHHQPHKLHQHEWRHSHALTAWPTDDLPLRSPLYTSSRPAQCWTDVGSGNSTVTWLHQERRPGAARLAISGALPPLCSAFTHRRGLFHQIFEHKH